jgi:hypothetical protein
MGELHGHSPKAKPISCLSLIDGVPIERPAAPCHVDTYLMPEPGGKPTGKKMCFFVFSAAVPNSCQIPRSAGLVQQVFGAACHYRAYLGSVFTVPPEEASHRYFPASAGNRIFIGIRGKARQQRLLMV